MADDKSRLVYSSDQSVSRKEKPTEKTRQAAVPSGRAQGVRVRLEKKGRAGKSVTVIEGLPLHASELDALLRQLKARLGTGGTLRDGMIEIQGDRADALMAELKASGYSPKRSGG